MSKEEIKAFLEKYRVVAVVGLSRDVGKPSHKVAIYLKQHGYSIIPVNPFSEKILDETSYRSLTAMPEEIQKTIEIVDIFRPSDDVPHHS